MPRRWRCAALLATLAVLVPRAAPGRPCPGAPLCSCRPEHLACDSVPYHRFPDTGAGVSHVALWAARLSTLVETALDARPLRTLVLVASHLHHIDPAAFASMSSSLASLDLGHNEFTEVPGDALRCLQVLNWLNLQNNYISDLEPEMDWGGLTESLSSLSLSNNQISVIREGALWSLRQLVQLDLDGNRLLRLEAGGVPPGISVLRLSHNLLAHVPCRALVQLPRLRHLHLRNNILQPANASCRSNHSRIDSLDLSHNELADGFHFDFYLGPHLKRLVLDLNDFTAVPTFILTADRLEKLSISYNDLGHVSETALHALKRTLERLEFDHNLISATPDCLRDLARLRHLSLSYNRLFDVRALPPKLHTLNLAGNFLTAFPSGLQNLSTATLLYLDLGYNRISHIGADVFGAWSERLTTLSVRGNRIAHLTVGAFPQIPLRELILSFNELLYVEAGVFTDLSQLRVLELSSASLGGEIPAGSTSDSLTWLGLDNNNIHFISSADIQNFPLLEYLNLDFNKLIEFPSDGRHGNGSYKLKELRLSYNRIGKINSEFLSQLSELQSADFSYNRVHNVSERGFAGLPSLVYVSLTGNGVQGIADRAFVDLPKLEALDVQENGLVEFSLRYFENVSNDEASFVVNASFNRVSSLVAGPAVPIAVLDLSHNSLETISKDFFESLQEHIRQLFVGYNNIIQVDSFAFSSLPYLSILNLNNNKIVMAKRRAFAEMPSLEILDLSRNLISQLSVEQFHNLRSLRHLKLASNGLRALPRDAFKNTLIEFLDLSDNRLSLFPSSALSQVGFTLRRLELARNRVEYLDAAMLRATAFLHELGLARNALTVLSDNTFAGLPRLRTLDISHNAIKANFRELFRNVPKLRGLSLSNIGLKAAPHLPLPNLTELNLSGNHISSYGQADVKHLPNLRVLDISANALTSLRPAMWSAFPHLMTLDVSHNSVVRMSRGPFDGLHRLMHLKMTHLSHLETLEPLAFRELGSLRSLALQSRTGEGRQVPLAELVSAARHLEALVVLFSEDVLDSQLTGLRAPKLRSLEVRGAALRRVGWRAFGALGGQRALSLRLTGTGVARLPAGLVLPLMRVPHLALDFSDNRLVSFEPAVLYPNLTGWHRLATKLLPGGLMLSSNPLRCGCSAAWAGGWLRRWASEASGGARGARQAARRSTCGGGGGRGARPLIALPADAAGCRADAPSGPAPPRAPPPAHHALLTLAAVYSLR